MLESPNPHDDTGAALHAEVNEDFFKKLMESECSICGCRGLHACLGYKPRPWTPEERARFEQSMKDFCDLIAQKENEETLSFVSDRVNLNH